MLDATEHEANQDRNAAAWTGSGKYKRMRFVPGDWSTEFDELGAGCDPRDPMREKPVGVCVRVCLCVGVGLVCTRECGCLVERAQWSVRSGVCRRRRRVCMLGVQRVHEECVHEESLCTRRGCTLGECVHEESVHAGECVHEESVCTRRVCARGECVHEESAHAEYTKPTASPSGASFEMRVCMLSVLYSLASPPPPPPLFVAQLFYLARVVTHNRKEGLLSLALWLPDRGRLLLDHVITDVSEDRVATRLLSRHHTHTLFICLLIISSLIIAWPILFTMQFWPTHYALRTHALCYYARLALMHACARHALLLFRCALTPSMHALSSSSLRLLLRPPTPFSSPFSS
jgi:hypothetical protein